MSGIIILQNETKSKTFSINQMLCVQVPICFMLIYTMIDKSFSKSESAK